MCGPLLNYHGMTEEGSQTIWRGSVLLVVEPGQQIPHLTLRSRGPIAQHDASQSSASLSQGERTTSIDGLKLYQDPFKTFWRFTLLLPLDASETKWEYSIPNMHFGDKAATSPSREFVVPAVSQSMRLMFHSCNGFSVGTDEDYWSGEADLTRECSETMVLMLEAGPVLWNNVLELHAKRPFHCMIGGGDQIYNDSVRVSRLDQGRRITRLANSVVLRSKAH
jgi:hypothetical protein